jgi:sugar lactone lactonase YvrE
MVEVKQAFPCRNFLGEGPVWSIKEQVLYWLDIEAGDIYRWSPSTMRHDLHHLGFAIGCLAVRKQGGLILATKRGFVTFDPQTGVAPIVNPLADQPGLRFNDGAVDRFGRFFAGTMHDKENPRVTGSLYRLNPDHSLKTMMSGLGTPNGTGWSLDNKTMYWTDSRDRTIYAFDYDPATGEMANQRPFVKVPDGEGTPDGMTVDSEGCIWGAHWGGWKVSRYDPAGKVMQVIAVPVERPSSVMFGGKNLDELYITTADQGISAEEYKKQPFSGDLLVAMPGVKGLPEPEFAG